MQAFADCIEFWNGWYRRVRKGENLNPRAIVVNRVPDNVVWDGDIGRTQDR